MSTIEIVQDISQGLARSPFSKFETAAAPDAGNTRDYLTGKITL